MTKALRSAPSLREFIAIVALIMALISLSIDNLLPAFEPIRRSFGVANANDMQLIVTVYMIGSGTMQIVYGTVSDVIGRRPTLLFGIFIYCVGALLGMIAHSYEALLVGRLVQGAGAAAAQVLTVALVRDRVEGREMSRVLSLVFMVFIMVPVVAPALGSLLILLWGWRSIFGSMFAIALLSSLWFGLRMPETLPEEHRRRFSLGRVLTGIGVTMRERRTMGYGIAGALMMGSLMTYVSSSQQIFETQVYGLGSLFPLAFGAIAGAMGIAFFANTHLVRSFGMHRVAHVCLLLFALLSLVCYVACVAYAGRPPLLLFAGLLAAIQFLMCLMMPNFNAIAMEPLGAVAGTASAILGVFTTLGGTAIGMIVGHLFDGTVRPLGATYLACAVASVLAVLWGEGGRLALRTTR